jgi:hypothetical protein
VAGYLGDSACRPHAISVINSGLPVGRRLPSLNNLLPKGTSPPRWAVEHMSHHRCLTTSSPQSPRGPDSPSRPSVRSDYPTGLSRWLAHHFHGLPQPPLAAPSVPANRMLRLSPSHFGPGLETDSGGAASACFSREGMSRATGHCERPSPLISGHHARSGAQQSKLFCSRAFNRGSIFVPVCWSIPMSVSGWKILANPAARSVLEAAGAKTLSVPVDADGLDVAAGRRSASSAKLVYVTPGRQYPLGVVLSLKRRLELLRWAEQSGAVIFEDDYDSEFRFSGPPLAALKSLDAIDRVIYAGTFSKLLFPAIRLAYLVLPERLIDPFVSALSLTARHMPIWNQVILADFIAEGHFSRHLRRMRMLYSERSEALQEAAQTYWSDFLVMPRIESGLDVAVLLKPRIDDQAAAAAAERASIELRSLSWHSQRRPRLSGFVIGFAAIDTRSIFDGARRLARILEEQAS